MPIDATVPHWLEALAKPIDTRLTGQVFGTLLAGATNAYRDKQSNPSEGYNFSRGIEEARMSQSDPMWSMKKDAMTLQIAQHALELQKTQGTIDIQKVKVGALAHDQTVLPKWLQDNPTWEARQYATPPLLMSKEYQDQYNKLILDDARNIQHVAATAAIKDLSAKVNELTALNPEKGGQFSRLIGTKVDPKDLDVLNTALATERQKRDESIKAQAKGEGLETSSLTTDAKGNVKSTFARPRQSPVDQRLADAYADAKANGDPDAELIGDIVRSRGRFAHQNPVQAALVKSQTKELDRLNSKMNDLDRTIASEAASDNDPDKMTKFNAAKTALQKQIDDYTKKLNPPTAAAPTNAAKPTLRFKLDSNGNFVPE